MRISLEFYFNDFYFNHNFSCKKFWRRWSDEIDRKFLNRDLVVSIISRLIRIVSDARYELNPAEPACWTVRLEARCGFHSASNRPVARRRVDATCRIPVCRHGVRWRLYFNEDVTFSTETRARSSPEFLSPIRFSLGCQSREIFVLRMYLPARISLPLLYSTLLARRVASFTSAGFLRE